MHKVMLLLAPILLLLSGCAGWVVFGHTIGQEQSPSRAPAAPQAQPAAADAKPQPAAADAKPQPATADVKPQPAAADPKLRAVSVTFTPEAKQKIARDPRFDRDALLAAIHTDFQTHGLLDDDGPAQSDHTVEIVIDDFATQPTSNAVVLGYVFSSVTLSGNIEVRDAAGRGLRTFDIKADSRLTTRADSEQPQSLGALYRRFADLTVSELTGIKAPDDSNIALPETRQHQ